MIIHKVFPTIITEFKYDNSYEFKNIFKSIYHNHITSDGFSNEKTGHVALHHDNNLEDLYKFIIKCVKQYVETMNVDSNKFEYNVVKSFLNIINENVNPAHNHKDAHISFVYYINIPNTFTKCIRFYNYENRHEPYSGFCKFNNINNVWNEFNSYTWQFEPYEGQTIIFPSNLTHDTVGEIKGTETGINDLNFNEKRITLVGDILLTYKQLEPSPLGLQPIKNWRTFDS